ncbi:MAG TPA: hypothetical protein VJT81_10580 [Burkholderiales bacterium]|nr:hypothetical protein [Burkholderiales bacterium]
MCWTSAAVATALLVPALAYAAPDSVDASSPTSSAQAPGWAFSATGMYYFPPDQDSFLLVVGTADRGSLHLEARYNYEALDTGSLFAGWTFSGGDKLTYELTPILGAVFGATQGVAPGFEASLAYGIADFYIEAEYLHDFSNSEDSYTYAWSELGFTPLEWLRFGLVGQRTRVYSSDLDIQRGGFVQIISGKMTFGLYVFNPTDSADRVSILSFGAQF